MDGYRVDGARQGRGKGERREGRDTVSPLDVTPCPFPINTSKSTHILQAENERLAFLLNSAFTLRSKLRFGKNKPKMEK